MCRLAASCPKEKAKRTCFIALCRQVSEDVAPPRERTEVRGIGRASIRVRFLRVFFREWFVCSVLLCGVSPCPGKQDPRSALARCLSCDSECAGGPCGYCSSKLPKRLNGSKSGVMAGVTEPVDDTVLHSESYDAVVG